MDTKELEEIFGEEIAGEVDIETLSLEKAIEILKNEE